MKDQETRERAVHQFFRAVDLRDWEAVRGGLATHVDSDYTSLFGGDPETVTGDALVEQWRAMLPGFDATQHFLGPLVHTGRSTVECNVRGHHWFDGAEWMVAGWYVLTLQEDGRVGGITLLVSYESGDRSLVERAQRRAGA